MFHVKHYGEKPLKIIVKSLKSGGFKPKIRRVFKVIHRVFHNFNLFVNICSKTQRAESVGKFRLGSLG